MRWDSPPVLVVIGTLAIHTLLLTAGDAIATYTHDDREPAPQLELFDIVEPPPLPPPPPVAQPEPRAREPQPEPPPVAVAVRAPAHVAIHSRPTPIEPPPDPTPPSPNREGGAPVVAMDDLAPEARGVAVARGPVNRGHIGRDGKDTGPGSAAGDGAGTAPAPMSIATIKTRALPHGDYSYFGAGKDYPAEAKALGIEGVVRMRLVVDATGRVSSATSLDQLGHGLDQLADRYAHAIVFDPARDTDDHPVASVVVWTFRFTLPR